MNDDVVEMKYFELESGKCSTILCVREIAMILPAKILKLVWMFGKYSVEQSLMWSKC